MLSRFPLRRLCSKLAGGFSYHKNCSDWGDICAIGQSQSPIDLSPSSAALSTSIGVNINYKDLNAKGEFIPHTYMVAGDLGSMTYKSGETTTETSAVQFHFHAPSEHTINTLLYALEMHIVHSDKQGNLYVIGIFFKDGNSSPFLEGLQSGQTPINLMQVFDHTKELTGFLDYSGSLTTPPCSEGVRWIVWSQVLTASAQQLKFFTSRWADNYDFAQGKGNNRPLQPLNGRIVQLKN